MVYKKSAKIHFVKYGVIKTVLYCLMSEVKTETRCSYETTTIPILEAGNLRQGPHIQDTLAKLTAHAFKAPETFPLY